MDPGTGRLRLPGKVQVLSFSFFFFRYFLKKNPAAPGTGTQGSRSLRSPRGQQVAVLPTPTGRSRAPPAGDSRRCGFLQVHVEATSPARPGVAGDPEAERKAGPSSMCAALSQPPRVPSGQEWEAVTRLPLSTGSGQHPSPSLGCLCGKLSLGHGGASKAGE